MSSTRIGFVLLSSSQRPQPSTRISVLNVLPHLRAAGLDPAILHDPAQDSASPALDAMDVARISADFDIVYFQKVHGPSVLRFVRALRQAGVSTVYGACDEVETSMVEATDTTVLVTEYLRSLQPASLRDKIHVVHDGIERPDVVKPAYGTHRGSRREPLRAVLVSSFGLTRLPVIGSPPPWLQVTIVGRYPPRSDLLQRLRETRWQFAGMPSTERVKYLRFLLDPAIRCVAWDPVDVYAQMLDADIGIIPIDTSVASGPGAGWHLKSENRLTMKMAAGLPVIATPIPAYEPVVRPGVDALFARSAAEWRQQLEALRDPALRQAMGRSARDAVLDRYSMQRQARDLVEVLRTLRPRPAASTPPAADVAR